MKLVDKVMTGAPLSQGEFDQAAHLLSCLVQEIDFSDRLPEEVFPLVSSATRVEHQGLLSIIAAKLGDYPHLSSLFILAVADYGAPVIDFLAKFPVQGWTRLIGLEQIHTHRDCLEYALEKAPEPFQGVHDGIWGDALSSYDPDLELEEEHHVDHVGLTLSEAGVRNTFRFLVKHGYPGAEEAVVSVIQSGNLEFLPCLVEELGVDPTKALQALSDILGELRRLRSRHTSTGPSIYDSF